MNEEKKGIDGPYQPDWSSLKNVAIPDWYINGKFGIFIHWGVYSVPAFGTEYYGRHMYKPGTKEYEYHLKTFGKPTEFGYKDFIPQFTANKFDPDNWASLFRKAGARFVVPVAEHHDGFPMYDCSYTDWCASKMGPQRDVIGELADATRRQGLTFGLSTHCAEHWWYFEHGLGADSDVQDARYADLYMPAQLRDSQPNDEFMENWLQKGFELIDKYQPQLYWFDWWIEQPVFQPYLKRFASYYYNRGAQWHKPVAINYKFKSFPKNSAVLDIERGQLGDIRQPFWQTDTAISKNSWGYVQNQDYKTAESLIGDLIDIVSKNGALLLNIGPKPDGTIPETEIEVLCEIGDWLTVNGEAIYDSRPWKVYGEGPTEIAAGSFADTKRSGFTSSDIRFSVRGGNLYAMLLGWPDNGSVRIQSLASTIRLFPDTIKSVELLGSAEQLKWSRTRQGLNVQLPKKKPCKHAFTLRITKGE